MLGHPISLLIMFSSALLLSACGSSSTDSGQENSDTAIIERIYLDKRTPDNFYTNDEDFTGDSFYSVSHVKNIELLSPAEKIGLPQYELSTDDFAEALDWSETAANNQPVYTQLVDNSDTPLYYQFTRVDSNNSEFIHLSRVYKASVIDRSGVDLSQAGSYQGRIVSNTYSTTLVKQIIEYLWTFSFNNNYGNAVLESSTTETSSSFTHTLLEAKMTSNGASSCDTIEVFESYYFIDKATGEIWRTTQSLRTLQATFNGTFASLCT